MENFKEIAEKCLAGELSGTFKLASGESVSSYNLERLPDELQSPIYQYQICVNGTTFLYTIYGTLFKHKNFSLDIINFIPDNMQKKIKIDIPEGKVPVMEQTANGVVITWKEKELTYKDIENKILLKNTRDCIIGYTPVIEDIKTLNCPHSDFYKKVEVLRKLINIRNYFGKPGEQGGFIITPTIDDKGNHKIIFGYSESQVMFKEKEHVNQAIKMLGDELKYLFEPW